MTTERDPGSIRFDTAVHDAIAACIKIGYRPAYFIRMLGESGALETAIRLINSNPPSEGFTTLWELRRLDLTVEAIASRPEFATLFDPEVLEKARRRLREYGFDIAQ